MNRTSKILQDRVQQLEAEIESLKYQQRFMPEGLDLGESENSIRVNGINILWDTVAGICTFSNVPVAMLWVDSTLAGLMSGLATMVGEERFALALQAEGRNSVESDWLMISKYDNFKDGFSAINHTASVAGWGDWRLTEYSFEQQKCVFRAFNNWEGLYQKSLGVCWGSGLLAGKLSGICSKLFNTACWATQTTFIANGDAYDEFIVEPSSRSIEEEIEQLLITDKATRADMAVALEKLRKTEISLLHSEQELLEINERLEERISERTKALRLSQFTIEHTAESVFWFSATGEILDVNESACSFLGYSHDELLALSIKDIDTTFSNLKWIELWQEIQRQETVVFETQLCCNNGRRVFVEISGNYVKFDEQDYICAFVRNITRRKQNEEKIRQLAYYDPLTLLPNRLLFYDRINHALAALSRRDCFGAVLFIDLDNFKTLNDSFGHDFGDLLLVEVAQRLLDCVRSEDTVARLGGDEFVIILKELSDSMEKSAYQSKIVAEKILLSINQAFDLKGYEYYSSPSIGIKLFQGSDKSVDELLMHADTAMYESKRNGRNTLRFFNAEMQKQMDKRATLDSALHIALIENQFEIYYQAQKDSSKGIVGAEVLLRWGQPDVGYVSPSVFIPIAEENGLIILIGKWVLEMACKQLKKWESDPGMQHLQLAVNVSYCQFNHPDFIHTVKDIMEKSMIDPKKLKLELTESILPKDIEQTIQKMSSLKSLGVCGRARSIIPAGESPALAR